MIKKSLTKATLTKLQKTLHKDWKVVAKTNTLERTFAFKNFIEGFMFVTRISVHAEVLRHHPEIHLTHNAVKVILTTHDTKSITLADFELAKRCDGLHSLSTEKASANRR